MRLSNKIIEEVVSNVAGPDVIELVHMIKNKKNLSEFKIAEDLELEINVVRNQLYRLYHANLVSFTRKKDKKKGWYIYYWTFKPKQIKHLLENIKKDRLEKLKDRLKREEDSYFFACKNSCMRLDFEKAVGFEFKCPECEELMQQESNKDTIKKIKEEIKELEEELK